MEFSDPMEIPVTGDLDKKGKSRENPCLNAKPQE